QVELASLLTCTSLKLIGCLGIGYSFDPMVMDAPINEYTESIKQLLYETQLPFPTIPNLMLNTTQHCTKFHCFCPLSHSQASLVSCPSAASSSMLLW
ncbi:hypothetical protein B0H10DRAFT_1787734, partial [Mycena sp. CBHHK59/15]